MAAHAGVLLDNGVHAYGPHVIAERNATFEVAGYAPGGDGAADGDLVTTDLAGWPASGAPCPEPLPRALPSPARRHAKPLPRNGVTVHVAAGGRRSR
ncbi:hypothetical protein [Saccharothrix yanglingensis]|uniref:Uncharacterized protein n=1 Tax=Saccharothrix yanglingensis TaxID=659496 RepID=A0ABU0WVD0_9PSEU|nr:hypothetical protein [Saccharothrix yanglingensis]MDQ2583809.1 hypothetical protein [Saccharothrix yanglingensis]